VPSGTATPLAQPPGSAPAACPANGDEDDTGPSAQSFQPEDSEESAEEVLGQAQSLEKILPKGHPLVLEYYERHKLLVAKKQEAKSLDSQLATKMRKLMQLDIKIRKKKTWAATCLADLEEKRATHLEVCQQLDKLEETKLELDAERAQIVDLLHLQQHNGEHKEETACVDPILGNPQLSALHKLATELPGILAHFSAKPGVDACLSLQLHTASLTIQAALKDGFFLPPLSASPPPVTGTGGKEGAKDKEGEDEELFPDKEMPDAPNQHSAKDKQDVSSHPDNPAGKKANTNTGAKSAEGV
jgi:hypothetical protein